MNNPGPCTPLTSDITRILSRIEQGDSNAAEQLLPVVYQELRRLAAHKLANETANQTLQPTALVHEAWLRLVGETERKYTGRDHFFAAAAEAMRRILIDRARRRRALRREGEMVQVELDGLELPIPMEDEQLLALHEALDRLAEKDPTKAELVKLKFFVGLTLEEAAAILDLSTPTAKRHWAFARAWLYREMTRGAAL